MQINSISSFTPYNTKSQLNTKHNVSFGWISRSYRNHREDISSSRRRLKSEEMRKQEQERIRAEQEKIQLEVQKNLLIKKIRSYLAESTQVRHTRDVQRIFDILGIRTQQISNNQLIIEKYRQPDEKLTFSELGIDENRMFNFISKIHLNADFTNSKITNLGKLETIGGDVFLNDNSTVTEETLKNIQIKGSIIKK